MNILSEYFHVNSQGQEAHYSLQWLLFDKNHSQDDVDLQSWSKILLKKSGDHPLRLVVCPIAHKGFVQVQDFFHQKQSRTSGNRESLPFFRLWFLRFGVVETSPHAKVHRATDCLKSIFTQHMGWDGTYRAIQKLQTCLFENMPMFIYTSSCEFHLRIISAVERRKKLCIRLVSLQDRIEISYENRWVNLVVPVPVMSGGICS